MVDTSSFLSIYNSAPWVFDGLLLCILLGVLFRELFKKTRLSEDPKKSQTIGGVIGFCLGIMLVGYMEFRGIHLIPDIGPWIIVALILLVGVLAWTWIDEKLGKKHRIISALIVGAITLLFLVLVLTGVPLFSSRVGSFTGSFIPAGILSAIPATFIFIALLVFLALVILVIVYLVMSLAGAATGGAPVESGLGRLLGWGGRALKGLAGYGASAGKWTFGKAVPFLAGKAGAVLKAAGKKIAARFATVDKINKELDKLITDTIEAVNRVSTALEKAKVWAKGMKQILNLIIKQTADIEQKIATAKAKDLKIYSDNLKALAEKLKQAQEEFRSIKIYDVIIDAERRLSNITGVTDDLTAAVANAAETMKELVKQSTLVKPERNEELIKNINALNNDANFSAVQVRDLVAEFKDHTKDIFKAEDLKAARENIDSITSQIAVLLAEILDTSKDVAAFKPSESNEVRTNLTKVRNDAEAARFLIKTFERATIYSSLEPGNLRLKQELEVFLKKKSDYLKFFAKIKNTAEGYIAKLEKIRHEEAEISAEERLKHRATVSVVLKSVREQRAQLLSLIEYSQIFINNLVKLSKTEITQEQIAKLRATYESPEEIARFEAKGKVYEKTEEGAVPKTGKGVKFKKFKKTREEAEAQLRLMIASVKENLKEEVALLEQGKAIVRDALIKIKLAEKKLASLLKKELGISFEEKKKLEKIHANMVEFLGKENEIIKHLEDYENFITGVVAQHIKEVELKKKKTLRADTILKYALEGLKAIKEDVEKYLAIEEGLLISAFKAEKETLPSGTETGGLGPAVKVPLPPRV